jgi:hypothetical protein
MSRRSTWRTTTTSTSTVRTSRRTTGPLYVCRRPVRPTRSKRSIPALVSRWQTRRSRFLDCSRGIPTSTASAAMLCSSRAIKSALGMSRSILKRLPARFVTDWNRPPDAASNYSSPNSVAVSTAAVSAAPAPTNAMTGSTRKCRD